MAAFTFVDPLLPLYIQQVGGLTIKATAFWAEVAASGLGIAMFFISPLWGLLADRFGRKAMVLRAMFGGAVVLSLMSMAPNIYLIVVLRWMQGLVTGSVAAMTALASSIGTQVYLCSGRRALYHGRAVCCTLAALAPFGQKEHLDLSVSCRDDPGLLSSEST